MKNYLAENVDEYIAGSPEESRAKLNDIRALIKSTIPKATESISWGVPFYKYHGLLGGFAVFKNHVSFGLAFVIDDVNRKMLEEKGYKTGSKTVQIRFDQKTPTKEIKQILMLKAKMNEAKRSI